MTRYDIAIIGTGPAGLEAAITAKVRNKNIILFGNKELSNKMQVPSQNSLKSLISRLRKRRSLPYMQWETISLCSLATMRWLKRTP